MSTAHVLLGLLAGGPRHGYDLKRAHDERLPRAKPLAYGQVYATLSRLERDGFVAESGQDRDGGPDRTSYELTDEGRGHLAAWLAAVDPPAPYVNSEIFNKVTVALLAAGIEQARDYLVAQRAAHMGRMRELTMAKSAPGASLGDVIAADYAIGHLEADLRWLQTTLARVAAMTTELPKDVTT
ncbi:helix-turn-helix transcriptional regulator [Paractinoplanes durhamensis]|uniref:PadR family transcriptional regulator n=1 Tax=Paractinoplanes durhamensis TaxID=113563 RepID=A0ABQ3Z0Y4_9ACTN|nr:helix-turn-helix transcriptional regulator [Actinoplanes durhamensis]GIE03488.1 PadR family transcriptional regulator [Actinoplanes durhamensis]